MTHILLAAILFVLVYALMLATVAGASSPL